MEIDNTIDYGMADDAKLIEIINRNLPKVDWDDMSVYPLSELTMATFADKLNWRLVLEYQSISKSFMRKIASRINGNEWKAISKHCVLSESFIAGLTDFVDWRRISKYQVLSEPFIRAAVEYIDWQLISRYQRLSESFIREFKHNVDWDNISVYQELLSDEFKQQFSHKVFWNSVENSAKYKKHSEYVLMSRDEDLTEAFMSENAHLLYWRFISLHQKMSVDFIYKHRKRIVFTKLLKNKHVNVT